VKALGYVWSAPTVLLALLWLLPMWLCRQARPVRWRDGAWEWEVVKGSTWHYFWLGWSGVTLGWAILFAAGESDVPRCAAHERVHVRQALWLGPFYLPVWLLLTALFGYRGNPMEKAAYRVAP
jgi:hypothetical protein